MCGRFRNIQNLFEPKYIVKVYTILEISKRRSILMKQKKAAAQLGNGFQRINIQSAYFIT